MVTGDEEDGELLFIASSGRGCWGRLRAVVAPRPPATPSARMIWVPGVMGVPGGGGYIRTGLSFFIGSTGLQHGESKSSVFCPEGMFSRDKFLEDFYYYNSVLRIWDVYPRS
jgi:hypothetical protein